MSSSAYDVCISTAASDAEWDRFLAVCPNGHHEQTSLWAQFRSCYGWRPIRIVVRDRQRIVGGVQILVKDVGRWTGIGYVMRGPAVAHGVAELVDITVRQIELAARLHRLSYVAVVPPYDGRAFELALSAAGFRRKPNGLPPGGVMTATLVVDLRPDLETLFRDLRGSTRKHVRRAARSGVTVREGAHEDLETFRRLMWALCARRGAAPTPPQQDFFENLWRIFQPAGFVKLLVAERNGRTIASVIAFAFGDTLRLWKIGWGGDDAKSYPNDALYWESIRWAKTAGYRCLDFVQIDEAVARDMTQGRLVVWPDRDAGTVADDRSTTFFKLGFGGTPLVLPQPYYRFYHPVAAALMRGGGARLIESRFAARAANRLWGRMAGRGE